MHVNVCKQTCIHFSYTCAYPCLLHTCQCAFRVCSVCHWRISNTSVISETDVVILTKFSLLAAPEAVILTISSAGSVKNFLNVTIFSLQWWRTWIEIFRYKTSKFYAKCSIEHTSKQVVTCLDCFTSHCATCMRGAIWIVEQNRERTRPMLPASAWFWPSYEILWHIYMHKKGLIFQSFSI